MSVDNPYLLFILKTHKQYNGMIKFKDASIYKPEHVYLHELCPFSFLDFTGLNNKAGPGPAQEFWRASMDIYWSHIYVFSCITNENLWLCLMYCVLLLQLDVHTGRQTFALIWNHWNNFMPKINVFEHQISIVKCFLKYHMTLKIGVRLE